MSRLATVVKPQAIPPSKTIARCSMTVRACLANEERHKQDAQRRRRQHGATARAYVGSLSAGDRFEEVFIRSLVVAGSCRQHRPWPSYPVGRRRGAHNAAYHPETSPVSRHSRDSSSRGFSSRINNQHTAVATPATTEPGISRDEYQELANTYPDFGQPRPKRKTKYQPRPRTYFALAPRLVLTPEQEFRPQHGDRVVLAAEDEAHQRSIGHLQRLLRGRLGRISQLKLWEAWEALPTPRPRYLDDETLALLFRHLTWVEHKHGPDAMPRFLAVMNECTTEQFPLPTHVWNTAISFAGRWVRRVTSQEVKSAVEMWMRMEKADVRADTVTFNILFDVALKANRFALADMILAELRARNLPPNRYTRAGLIYHGGARADGDAVRRAFQDFVSADEIVDTSVMNTVIAALLRAGEAPAAESVFHKMKHLHARKFGTLAPASWQAKRELGSLLGHAAARLRAARHAHEHSFFGAAFSSAARKDQIQHASPIAPDAATYRLLLQHHVYASADAQRAADLLAEMRQRRLHVHGSVYFHLFRGFDLHGGSAFSSWTLRALEALWDDLLVAVAGEVPEVVPGEREPIAQPESEPEPVLGEVEYDDDLDDLDGLDDASEHDGPGGEAMARERRPDARDAVAFGDLDDRAGADEEVLSELERKPYLSTGLAVAVVGAFHRCAGRERVLEVWAEILSRWKDVTEEERARVQEVVDQCGRRERVPRL